jgi:hypothetical protein
MLFARIDVARPSILYVAICVVLVFAEVRGTYLEIKNDRLIQRYMFLYSMSIALGDITAIRRGEPYGIAHARSIYYYFNRPNGGSGHGIILPDNFEANVLVEFIKNLRNANSKIQIDEHLIPDAPYHISKKG